MTATSHNGTDGRPGTIRLTKHHGLGNDFLVAVEPSRPLSGDDAVRWCDRRRGIGADGLIQATAEAASTDGGQSRWRMTLWNADGGRAEISGNGIRCLGQAVAAHLGLDRSVEQRLMIDTDAGARLLVLAANDRSNPDEHADRVRVAMGKAVPGPSPSERWDEVAVAVRSQIGVDIGNPHLVAFVDTVGDADMATIGPVIEADYPAGVNVHLVEVAGPDHLILRVWERGVGVTQACGSGASAAAWAAVQAGLVTAPVTVDMPGGSVSVAFGDEFASAEAGPDEVFLTGPTVRVGEVILDA